MDSTAVCTLVHRKETTRQIALDSEQDLSRFLTNVDESSFLDNSYRSKKLMENCDLVAILKPVLGENDSNYGTNMLERFQKCRTMAWHVQDPETWLIRVQSNSCRLRWCPMCAKARVSIISHNCFEFLSKQKAVRFLTLTMKHSDLPLSEQIRRMKKCFVKLGRRVGWKKYVTGSIAFLHVKRNDGNTAWHVHLHILLAGSYVPQQWLSAEWLKVTGDSPVVHVQAANSEKELGASIKDFTRYAGCPANLLKIPIEHRLEIVHAFEGVRVCWATGICKDVSLSPPKYKQGNSKMINLGRDSTIRMRAKTGDFDALCILYCSGRECPFENAPSFRDDDDFIDNEFLGLSQEPMERSPPEKTFFDYEGGVLDKNAPW